MTLNDLVGRHLENFTVIATVLEILHAHIEAIERGEPFVGITADQVETGFNRRAKEIGKRWFFPSYLQRHSKSGDFFVEKEGTYRLRDELLLGANPEQLRALRDRILEHWRNQQETRRGVLASFHVACALPMNAVQDRHDFIEQVLSRDSWRNAQLFEIVSFAILHTYFATLGFSLRRFSTTFANDGGMDFICGEGIYQVTASGSSRLS